MSASLLFYFTDPVMRGPTIGCMLMGLAASLIGVIAYLKERSLLGETLSHCTYPGVVIAIGWGALLLPHGGDLATTLLLLLSAFLLTLLGFGLIQFLERRCRLSPDAALCFVLATFFGLGLTLASYVQQTASAHYRRILSYLYGQAATMTDSHILFYAVLALLVLLLFLLFYKELQINNFDPPFARVLKVRTTLAEFLFFILTVLTVVSGVRSVGVILMAAMFIAPPVAAKQYARRLSQMLLLSGLIGMLSGLIGNIASDQLDLPTGPAMVLSAFAFALFALAFSPRSGFVTRFVKIIRFRSRCMQENILKHFVYQGEEKTLPLAHLLGVEHTSFLRLKLVVGALVRKGWLLQNGGGYALTAKGRQRALRIIRLHRLWEVYLCDYIGYGAEKVHCNAEEMEHIITPELEKKLTALLQDPRQDPHHQPIPQAEGCLE